jgi:hypothetical protein
MVRVQSTQQFLECKLANLEQRLRADYHADEDQLQRIHQYICVVDGGIKQYAQSLGGMNLQDAASRLVEMLHIDADNKNDATQMVVQYMDMFLSVCS